MTSNRSAKRDGIREAWQQHLAETCDPARCSGDHPAISADESGKVYENRLRRMAERQGLQLAKSRRRDPRALGFGTYMLVDLATNGVMASGLQDGYGLTLAEVEAALTQ